MAHKHRSKSRKHPRAPQRESTNRVGDGTAVLRIIGGTLRGSKLAYSGQLRTRPMKDRVREAIFNLVGPPVKGSHAIDLFAGSGALALEAISRGAKQATMIEQHHPTARILRRNVENLNVADKCRIVNADVFVWFQQRPNLGALPWSVFCSPPYRFYQERTDAMLGLIEGVCERAPVQSVLAVESDAEFDTDQLPFRKQWDVRTYSPAVVAMYYKAD